jgi:hypothetical protein
MPIAGISQGLGIGGGTSATISGAPAGGGTPFTNEFSASLDGANDSLSIPKELNPTICASAFTFSAWIYPDTNSGYDYILSNGVPLQIIYYQSKIKMWLSTTDGVGGYYSPALGWPTTATVSTGGWTYLTVVKTATDLKYYLNGSLDSTHTYSAATTYNPDVAVGLGDYIAGGYPFDGLLEEVSIFNSAISAANVTTIWNDGNGPGNISALDPVAWWRMGDSVGDVNTSGGVPADTGAIGTIVNAATGSNSGGSGLNATGVNGPAFSTTIPT